MNEEAEVVRGMYMEILESFKEKKFVYTLFTCLIIIFLLILFYFRSTNGKVLHGLSVSGVNIGGLKLDEAAWKLEKNLGSLPEKKVILSYNNRNVPVVLGAIGFQVDLTATVRDAYLIGRTGSIWSRISTRFRIYRKGRELKPVVYYNQDILESFYRLLDAGVAVEPVRSVISVTKDGKISYTNSRAGKIIDYHKLTTLLKESLTAKNINQIGIPIKTIIPPLNEADIKQWGLDQVMGIYSTKFNSNQTDRVENIKIACSAINNSLVYPGQSFSFNTWVGPRASEAGYKEAPVVFQGKLIPGIGGGICQVSTTLYNSVLLANLLVIQRRNHTIPSTYVPLGRDATVVYGGVDFIFQNNNQKPILLAAAVEPPYVTVAVLGQKTGWEQVTLENNILETFQYKTVEVPDSTLYEGKKIKTQDGQNGYKVELWRMVQLPNGQIKQTLENTSIYPAQPEEYKVGTKPK